MRRVLLIVRVLVRVLALVVALSLAPAIGVLVALGHARPRLYQHAGRDFEALRFDGPRIQYWHGEYFAAEQVVDGERYYFREVQPNWDEQHAPSTNRLRMPTGSFLPFDEGTRWGFSSHPWWPPIGAPATFQTSGPQTLPGADGQPHAMRSGPTLVVHTVMSWFVLAIVSVPWLGFVALAIVRRMRARRRAAVGHCRRCGYDLRASAGRCPECGTEHGVDATVARVAD